MIKLKVEVSIASFRQSRAREYAETYAVPPPSTVYGFLLSLVGETNRYQHCGCRLAIALLSTPEKSTVIRTFRRFKSKTLTERNNAKPDYQELLTDIKFVVWVEGGADTAEPKLVERISLTFAHPETVDRFGGLCLGESRDLVNSVNLLPEDYQGEFQKWLINDEHGLLTLPYWVSHVGSQNTRWQRYTIMEETLETPPEKSWTLITSAGD